jgi:hypothetical protein
LKFLKCKVQQWKENSVSSVWLRTGRPGFDSRQDQRIVLLVPASRPALGPIQPPIQWVPRVLSPGVKRGRGVTTHPHLVPRSRTSRSYSSFHPSASMACSGTALVLILIPFSNKILVSTTTVTLNLLLVSHSQENRPNYANFLCGRSNAMGLQMVCTLLLTSGYRATSCVQLQRIQERVTFLQLVSATSTTLASRCDLCNRSPFNVFILVVCWAPVDLDPREMVTPGSFNR